MPKQREAFPLISIEKANRALEELTQIERSLLFYIDTLSGKSEENPSAKQFIHDANMELVTLERLINANKTKEKKGSIMTKKNTTNTNIVAKWALGLAGLTLIFALFPQLLFINSFLIFAVTVLAIVAISKAKRNNGLAMGVGSLLLAIFAGALGLSIAMANPFTPVFPFQQINQYQQQKAINDYNRQTTQQLHEINKINENTVKAIKDANQ